MNINDHPIPEELQKLIESGVWPGVNNSGIDQERNPVIGQQATKRISPDEDKIVLLRPPFHTIADEVRAGNTFWSEFLSNVGEIDYSKAVIIADFGVGSDSPIILYYEDTEPCVMYLKWAGGGKSALKHSWVRTHDTFADFATTVELR